MGRSYLEKVDVSRRLDIWDSNNKRANEYREQVEKYGFCEQETWDMSLAFYQWLYERLKMYLEKASPIIDLEFYKFTYRDETLTQLECIKRMIRGCEIILFEDDYFDVPWTTEMDEAVRDVPQLWALVIDYMNW